MERKKKVLIQTDFSLAKTGFGRNAKTLLKHLYSTNKYDLVHYSCGMTYDHPEFKKTPWKTVGSLPNTQQELDQLNRDPNLARMASYGAHLLDKVINDEKPDIYIVFAFEYIASIKEKVGLISGGYFKPVPFVEI